LNHLIVVNPQLSQYNSLNYIAITVPTS